MPTATDNFNRASLGTSWTKAGTLAALSIYTSTTVGGSTGGTDNAAYYNAVAFASDHSSQIQLAALADDGGPLVRVQSGAASFYLADLSATAVAYFRCSGGTFSQLGATIATATWAVNDTVQLAVAGSTLTATLKGVALATRSDATFTGGSPGIHCSSNAIRWDNWTGTDGLGGATFLAAPPLIIRQAVKRSSFF